MLLDPTPEDLTVREIMRDCGGIGAIKKLAKRKLDAAGFINSDCCEANGPERTKRLKQALQLASSMAEIEAVIAAEAQVHAHEEDEKAQVAAPIALQKLRSRQMDFAQLYVPELRAIAKHYFLLKDKLTGKKATVVAAVVKLHTERPHVLEQAIAHLILTSVHTSEVASLPTAEVQCTILNSTTTHPPPIEM